MINRKLRVFALIAWSILVIAGGLANSVSAQSITADYENSECFQANTPYFDATTEVQPGKYDAYARLAKRGQSAPVSLYVEDTNFTSCQTIGSIEANGEAWTLIGTLDSTTDMPQRLQLSSPIFEGSLEANRPAVMLVPKDNPPCQPTVNCEFTFDGQPAFIVPPSTLLSEDSLQVMQVQYPTGDIDRVDYYADGQLMYTKSSLESFDLRYVPGGQHSLSRVIRYKSGQQVVIPSETYISFSKDFQNLLFRLLHSNSRVLQIITILGIITGLCLLVLAVLHALHRRHVWKLSHGLIHDDASQPISNLPENYVPPPHFLNEDSKTMRLSKKAVPYLLILFGVITVIGLTDSFVGQLFRVDGPSMQNTLTTDDLVYVNRLPKTWASLNRQEYVPKRGEVIVFQKRHSDLYFQQNPGQKQTYVIKRVLGLPGERVVVANGVITVYDRQNPDGFNPDQGSSWEKTMNAGGGEAIDVTLGPREVFVSGDNRLESLDSRENGPIDVGDIVGVAEAVVMPFSKRQWL